LKRAGFRSSPIELPQAGEPWACLKNPSIGNNASPDGLDWEMEPAKRHWTTNIGQAAGHPAAFLVVIVYALLWLTFSRATFEWNAVATLAVVAMTLFIQRTNRRDNLALQSKLDELLRVDDDARSELTQLDGQEPEVIERHRDAEVRKTSA
jgi:low affinity Fe/Cu permease